MSEYLFKIVVIGDPGVGKTQMRYRFTQNVYNDNSKTTIGVDFATKLLVQKNGEMVKGELLLNFYALETRKFSTNLGYIRIRTFSSNNDSILQRSSRSFGRF